MVYHYVVQIPRSSFGFTLVELLIVVTIIGTLATVAVPTFRRMIQKARQAEAKYHLGHIYRLEMAFFAEYAAFGDNLSAMGAEVEELDTPSARYVSGFYLASPSCEDHSKAFRPTVLTGAGLKLNSLWPTYLNEGLSAIGDATRYRDDPGAWCAVGSLPDGGTTFTATSSGVIAPGINYMSNKSEEVDQWSIDENRNLRNLVNGIR